MRIKLSRGRLAAEFRADSDRRDNRETNVTLSYRGDATQYTHAGVPGDRRSTTWPRRRTSRADQVNVQTVRCYTTLSRAWRITTDPLVAGVFSLAGSLPSPATGCRHHRTPAPAPAPARARMTHVTPRAPASRLLHRTFYMGCPFSFWDVGFWNIHFVNWSIFIKEKNHFFSPSFTDGNRFKLW